MAFPAIETMLDILTPSGGRNLPPSEELKFLEEAFRWAEQTRLVDTKAASSIEGKVKLRNTEIITCLMAKRRVKSQQAQNYADNWVKMLEDAKQLVVVDQRWFGH